MKKYIVKNCGNHDFCACNSVRNEDCLYKRIIVKCIDNMTSIKASELYKSEYKDTSFFEQIGMKKLTKDIFDLMDIEEIE